MIHAALPHRPDFGANESLLRIKPFFTTKVEILIEFLPFVVRERLIRWLFVEINAIQLVVQHVVSFVELLKKFLEQSRLFQILLLNGKSECVSSGGDCGEFLPVQLSRN